ncbi:Polyadenylate-binding protein-interacting protein 6 [Raphanus sativus]|nr:Polyadenylate-binding protein-interacting protein 6 [Raphanus sativus]
MKPGKSALNPHARSLRTYHSRKKRVVLQSLLLLPHFTCSTNPVEHMFMRWSPRNGNFFKFSNVHTCHNQQMRDEDLKLELDTEEKFAILLDNLSHESIIDAYLANSGDLDATIDMNQLLAVEINVILLRLMVLAL